MCEALDTLAYTVQPGDEGQIALRFQAAPNGAGFARTTLDYVSLTGTPVPEPTSAAFVSAAAVWVARRRRRPG